MNKRKILSILLVVILLSGISISSFASNEVLNNQTPNNEQSGAHENNQNNAISSSLDVLNQQKEDSEASLDRVSKQLEYVQTEMSSMLLEVQKLNDEITQYETQNKEMEAKIKNLETSIEETTQNLEIVTREYNQREEQLKNRLVALYEAGNISYLDVLLTATSLSDFLSIYYAMTEIAEYDNSLIDKVDAQRKQIDEMKTKLEEETIEMKAIKAKSEQAGIVLANKKTLQEGYMAQLSDKEQKLSARLQEYKKEAARIENIITQISMTQQEFEIQYTGGIMIWPVAISGTGITSYYGTREHPIDGIVRFHQGLDIGNTGFGAPAVAALDGIVTYSGWLGSYGNCVMIYHGNGITTLYAHGQRVVAEYGQTVKQGDVVLETGSTGNSTGPHLHFEVRVNGTTVNPLNYVRIP